MITVIAIGIKVDQNISVMNEPNDVDKLLERIGYGRTEYTHGCVVIHDNVNGSDLFKKSSFWNDRMLPQGANTFQNLSTKSTSLLKLISMQLSVHSARYLHRIEIYRTQSHTLELRDKNICHNRT